MVKVGLRELRQNASAYLRRVKEGETVQILDRGKPVALWVPLPTAGGIARLEAESRLSEVMGDVMDLGPPLPAVRGAPLPSETMAADRDDEG